ncbi:MAG: family 1 glycosylhydrolase [Streptococcus sp.]
MFDLRMVIFIRPRKVSICTTVTRKIWPILFGEMGFKTYRLSIAWSTYFYLRVMKLSQNEAGLAFYERTSSRNVTSMALNL